MFYSHDLLGRKTPLGAIWHLAHGTKLSKGKIISIDLRTICEEILQPGVPHALRLQGILMGGLVIVYNKQQAYLLEDLQEMMRRVKAAGKTTTAANGAGTSAAAGKNTLKRDRNQAKLESITLLDMEDLLAPVGEGAGDDFLGLELLGGVGRSSSTGSRGRRQEQLGLAGDGEEGEGELAEGLFIMPSLAATTSDAAGTSLTGQGPQGGKQHSRSNRSRSVSFAVSDRDEEQGPQGGAQQQQQQQAADEDMYGGFGGNLDHWNPDEEMFDVNCDLDLLGGLDMPGAAAAAAGGDLAAASAGIAADLAAPALSQQHPAGSTATRTTTTTTTTSSFDPNLDPMLMTEADEQQQLDFDLGLDQQQFDHPGDVILTNEIMTNEVDADKDVAVDIAAQQDQDRDMEGDAGAGAKPGSRKSKRRKLATCLVDDLDNLQIRSKEYREWVTDHSSLITNNHSKGTASAATLMHQPNTINPHSTTQEVAAVLLDPAAMLAEMGGWARGRVQQGTGVQGLGYGLLPAGLGLGLSPELLELFQAPVAAAAAAAAGVGGKRKAAPSSPEVNNSTGEGAWLQQQHESVHREPLPLSRVTHSSREQQQQLSGLEDGEVQGAHPAHDKMMLPDDLLLMPEEEEEQDTMQQQRQLSNDEAHDQLMDLPFADMEVERLRAAGGASPNHSGSFNLSSPGGTNLQRRPGSRRAESETSGGSSMLGLRGQGQYEGPDIDSEGAAGRGLRRRMGSADLGTMDELDVEHPDMYYGAGRLEDLLPDVPLPEDEEPSPDATQATEDQAAAAAAATGGLPRSMSGTLPLSSQHPLLEETEPLDATQTQAVNAGPATAASKKVLSIFRERLQPAGEDEAEDGTAATPSLSLFGLMKEGRLSRTAAAQLFYQVCVTSSAGYITANQERPFGDIAIRPGRLM